MKKFFQSALAATVGFFIAYSMILLVGLGVLGVTIAALSASQKVEVKPNSVLRISLSDEIQDRSSGNPLDHFDFGSFESKRTLGLHEILTSISDATDDENIRGIYLDASYVPAGAATKHEIREALASFKTSGKFVVAYAEAYEQSTYWLASVADEIYMHPEGYMDFKGLSASTPFFAGMLEKLEIEPKVIRHGKFKSAIEPFILEEMSEENRIQTEKFVGSIWDEMVDDVAESRKISSGDVAEIADSLLVTLVEHAEEYKLIDALKYEDEVEDILMEKVGAENETSFNQVAIAKYHSSKHDKSSEEKNSDDSEIAVIYAKGGIVSGEGDEDQIASETISKAIKKAREDENVKAVVFRINSGGGSALASDVIWREIELTKKEKPVVASFGNVAASGGYYIACGADKIIASPTTVTGSIGVFGLFFNMEDFYDHKLGIKFDEVNTNKFADMGSSSRPMSDYEAQVMQNLVEDVYDDFITKVADGRKMSKDEVDEIGQGRVWSGVDALEIGLVDQLGGLDEAIAVAAELAELENYNLKELPEQKNPFELKFGEMAEEARMNLLSGEMKAVYRQYQKAQQVLSHGGIQMAMPYEIQLK